jgi:hypothetical protein
MKSSFFLKLNTLAALLLGAPFSLAADASRVANTVVLDETGVKNLRIETIEVEDSQVACDGGGEPCTQVVGNLMTAYRENPFPGFDHDSNVAAMPRSPLVIS